MKNLLYIAICFFLISCQTNNKAKTIEGFAIGTTYSIKYISNNEINFESKIDSIVKAINKSTSTYIETSDISKINNGDSTVVVDEHFKNVFKKSKRIYNETNGYFDPTVGVLVNAWGFGPEKNIETVDSLKIDSLLKFVGFNKVELLQNNTVKKIFPEIYFDFNAIGKGYLVDCVGRMFEENGVANYMVEIGGEIRAQGINENKKPWRIAIENPNFDGTRSLAEIIELNNESIATSGNYRKFRIDSLGNKFVHTINPKTGYAKESNLLSASVIAKMDCADVDGYATAFMAMGLDKTKAFLTQHPELKALLIYANENGELAIYKTDNLVTQ
ncbi:MAG TPA: FAD:protein FMN transferase [Flavobacteriaceae bacterium]|nr:FAD:protein FMN transferase [Flavobacteriaceae bacterium]